MQHRRVVPSWPILLLVALAVRATTFGNPILHNDEQFYFTVASEWLRGLTPYVGIWDRKPIGLFLLYLPAAALGPVWGIWMYQALALASLVATAWLIARLADHCGWRGGAMAGGIAYILWADLLEGQGGQAPVFYNLLVAGAAWLALSCEERPPSWRSGAAAMALIGCALQIKYSVAIEGCYLGLVLLARSWRMRSFPGIAWRAASWGAIALAPTALVAAIYALGGEGHAWLYANLLSIMARARDPLAEQLGNYAIIAVIVLPLLAVTVAGLRRTPASAQGDAQRRFLLGWLVAALLGVAALGAGFDHYALPLLVPACVAASSWFGERRFARAGWVVLAVAAIAGQAMLLAKRADRGTRTQFTALALAVRSGPPGCLYVYADATMLYPASGRCTVTRYLFPSHLGRTRESGAVGVDQQKEMARLLAQRPAVVVLGPPYRRGERADVRALLQIALTRDYRTIAAQPLGRGTVMVYALKR